MTHVYRLFNITDVIQLLQYTHRVSRETDAYDSLLSQSLTYATYCYVPKIWNQPFSVTFTQVLGDTLLHWYLPITLNQQLETTLSSAIAPQTSTFRSWIRDLERLSKLPGLFKGVYTILTLKPPWRIQIPHTVQKTIKF